MLETGRELDRPKRPAVSLQSYAEAILLSQDNLPGWGGIRRGTCPRPPERLADLICDRRPAGSHIPQLTLAPRREFSSRERARPPNSNGGENIPNQDNERVHQRSWLMVASLPAVRAAASQRLARMICHETCS
jgi:hypothetical protein